MRAGEVCLVPEFDAQGNTVPDGQGGFIMHPTGAPESFVQGDFDGDHNIDVAVGLPSCAGNLRVPGPAGIVPDAGAVLVCWGRAPGPDGLCSVSDPSCVVLTDPAGLEEGARFGTALAAYPWERSQEPAPSYPEAAPKHVLVVGAPGATDRLLDVRMGQVRGIVLDRHAAVLPSTDFPVGSNPGPWNAWWTLTSRLKDVVATPAELDGARFGSSLAVGLFRPLDEGADRGSSLAIGAPGFTWWEGSVVHPEIGAVEVREGRPSLLVRGTGSGLPAPYLLGDQLPPFQAQAAGLYLPSRICGAGPQAGCVADGVGAACDGARFGAELAVGRFLEEPFDINLDGVRDVSLDLAVGAPGSPGLMGRPGSGHVEILPGASLPYSSTSAPPPVFEFGDECAGGRFLEQDTASPPVGTPDSWTIAPEDHQPESGDGYGSSLYAADLVGSIWADDHGQHKDELVIGVPGEDVRRWDPGLPYTGANYTTQPESVDAGAFCVVLFGDDDVQSVLPPIPEPYPPGPPDPPVSLFQRCVSTGQTSMSAPLTADYPDAVDGARLGTDLVAGRLSMLDPDFQVAVGAPGRPSDGVLPADDGAVYVFHFTEVWNQGFALAVDGGEGPLFSGSRVSQFSGGSAFHSVSSVRATVPNQLTDSPGRFGELVALWDRSCQGVPDLVVSEPDSQGGREMPGLMLTDWADPIVDSVTGVGVLDPGWSRDYLWTGAGEDLRVSVAAFRNGTPSYGQGYIYLWSNTNYTSAYALPDLPLDFADPQGPPFCTGLSMNWMDLPGPTMGIFNSQGMPIPGQAAGCAGDVGLEVPWSAPQGDRWAGFDVPRALHFSGADPGDPGAPIGWAGLDILAIELAAGNDVEDLLTTFAPNLLPSSGQPMSWTMDFELRQMSSSLWGSAVLCPTTATNANFTTPSTLNGAEFVNCEARSSTNNGLSQWILSPGEPLSCRRPWDVP